MNPVNLARLGAEALELAYEQGLDYRTPEGCGWALLVDAVATIAAGPSPRPRGYPSRSAMPDPLRSHWEIFAVERERISDRVVVETDCRVTPSARAVSRADEVFRVWHPQTFRGAVRAPDRVTRAMMLWAGGSRTARAAELAGVARGSMHRYRDLTSRTVGRMVLPHLERIAQAS